MSDSLDTMDSIMSVFIYYFWKWWWGNKKYLHIGQGFANSFIQSQQKRLVIRLIGWNSQVENTKSKCDNSKLEDYEALDTPFPMEIWIKKTNWQNTPVRGKKKKKRVSAFQVRAKLSASNPKQEICDTLPHSH